MKTLSKLFIVIVLLFFVCISNAKPLEKISVKGKNIVTESGEVIRLKGVSFSDPDKLKKDGQWNLRYFQEAKNWGCNVVRFPVHPPRLNNRGWDEYFKLLDQGVAWAEQLEMYVIIDWHIIGNLSTEQWFRPIYITSYDETIKFWKRTAEHFKGNPTVAVYELYNEPTNQGGELGELNWDILRALHEKVIDEISSIDDEKIFLVSGMNWGYYLNEVIENPVNRKNVTYTSHPYPQKEEAPWEAKWEKSWGHVADTYPIIATEFGFMPESEPGAHVPCLGDETYGKAIMDYFDKKGISFTLWSFDPDWAPTLIRDWEFTPSRQGKFFKEVLSK
jgi:hypothetical protein